MKVLLVTVSARGHAIAEALARSAHRPEIIHVCPTRNPGIRRLAKEQIIVDSLMNFPAILEVAKRIRPDFAFIAPDDPIGGGLADELVKFGIPSVAPKKTLARIESSKGFARELMKKHGIEASPKFRIFTGKIQNPLRSIRQTQGRPELVEGRHGSGQAASEIRNYIEGELRGSYVVKYDGLLGGKGVKVSGEHLASVAEGVAYAEECITKGGQVVIEEKLQGVEFSLMSFVSGEQVTSMPAVQDHKRAYEGDTGPNTGGMGSYSDADHKLPFLENYHIEEAHRINCAVAKALMEECGEPYKGILYGGFIAIPGMKGQGSVKVIEYNARFGDPEALNVLPILKTDFVEICQAIISGTLNKISVQFEPLATVCKYIVPEGYPLNKDQKGQQVRFPVDVPSNARIYYGDVSKEDHSQVLKNLRTSEISLRLGGSRTAGIVGIGKTLEEAEKIAQSLCEQVQGPVRFRSDIGTKELIERRLQMM